ncbi:MAG: ribbon-helix-helix protein, CopG family [Planctomycetes bacterium]|nr:ribbon-helix-helix protein, CopG family [Planctomycetota bacterium]
MVRTQIQLTEEQARRLRELARAEGVSIAELIRRGVEVLLESGRGLSEAERWAKIQRGFGRWRSGRSDVARLHDEYLAEALGR